MGRPKEWLPFGGEPMLLRVIRLLSEVVQPIVVVAAPGQDLPPLPTSIRVARDPVGGRGPLEGLVAGFAALPDVDAAYVTSCDVPLLQAEFVRHVIGALGAHDIAVPVEGRFHHPLAAVYRTSVASIAAELLAADQLRPVFLFDRVATHRIPLDTLRAADPELTSLRNLNHWEDYVAALACAGLPPPGDERVGG